MAVRQINQPQYTIDLSGFDHLIFTESSTEHLTLPPSVQFATDRDSVLQSAREAWAFRISANGTLESNLYQSTRTAAIGVKIDGDYYIAIDDNHDSTTNILLARTQEGYDSHRTIGKWLVPKSDCFIKAMLSRAEQEKRIVRAPLDRLELSTIPGQDNKSAYGAHPLPQAILGKDLTERVATYLLSKNFGNGYAWALSPANLAKLGVDDDHVEVRRVGVGGYVFSNIVLYAVGQCNDDGRARGVRENSTGNKG
jgi:hypothetical protein